MAGKKVLPKSVSVKSKAIKKTPPKKRVSIKAKRIAPYVYVVKSGHVMITRELYESMLDVCDNVEGIFDNGLGDLSEIHHLGEALNRVFDAKMGDKNDMDHVQCVSLAESTVKEIGKDGLLHNKFRGERVEMLDAK